MFPTHFITGNTVEKSFFRRFSNMLTKIESSSKKIYYYTEFANNKKTCIKRGKLYVQYCCINLPMNPHSLLKLIITLPMTLTPLQINLIITFAQSALTWQIP